MKELLFTSLWYSWVSWEVRKSLFKNLRHRHRVLCLLIFWFCDRIWTVVCTYCACREVQGGLLTQSGSFQSLCPGNKVPCCLYLLSLCVMCMNIRADLNLMQQMNCSISAYCSKHLNSNTFFIARNINWLTGLAQTFRLKGRKSKKVLQSKYLDIFPKIEFRICVS